jgi:hypothetical protein
MARRAPAGAAATEGDAALGERRRLGRRGERPTPTEIAMKDPLLEPMIEPVPPPEPMTQADQVYVRIRDLAEGIAFAAESGELAVHLREMIRALVGLGDRAVELTSETTEEPAA